MKKLVLIIVGTLLFSVPVRGQTSVVAGGEMLAPTSESPAKLVNLYPTHQFTDSWGMWLFAGVTPQWAEMLAGPLYSQSFAEGDGFAQFGIGAGFEQPAFTPRVAGSVFLKYQKLTFFGFLEYSEPTGRWHQAILLYRFKSWKAGLMSQGLRGAGPRIEFDVPKTPITAWGAYVKGGSWQPLVGIQLKL
ncbi:MAG: hypothetical protein BRC25_02700 [Parcubacteria group bacterium SW_6_46_9]|nr:MAG: hypothetical protein BRC25_02700 [Parcubacteria group bacterium SW_6_46_9]